MNNPSFFNARFLLPVFAVAIIIGVITNSQSDAVRKSETINGTKEAGASAHPKSTKEPEEAVDLAPSAEATAAEDEQMAKAAASKLAAAARAEADAAERKAKAEADKLAAAAKAEEDAAKQKAEAEAQKLAAAESETGFGQSKSGEENKSITTKPTAESTKTIVVSARDTSTPQYVVKDGKVDKATYNGYRRFHGTCHACHGQDAAGGSFAPSLVDSLKKIDYDLFYKTVTEGRIATGATGASSVMPAFSNDPNVMKHLDDIYRYLAGRADGAIGAGRPARLR